MAEINSFGGVMTFSINSETALQQYYQGIGNSERAAAADKRRVKLERIRREHVVEITLEPIDDLDDVDFPFNWDDTSETGQQHNERVLAQFYKTAAPKINVLPAQRALERCGEEHKSYTK